MSKIKIQFNCDNAAFEGDNIGAAIQDVLAQAMEKLEGESRADLASMVSPIKLSDGNGNGVGFMWVDVEADEEDEEEEEE